MSLAYELAMVQDKYHTSNPQDIAKEAIEIDQIYEGLVKAMRSRAEQGHRSLDVNFACPAHYMRWIDKKLMEDGFMILNLGCRYNIKW